MQGVWVFALGRVGDCQRSERNATGKPVALVLYVTLIVGSNPIF